MELTGRKAIITGASQGLGLAIAKEYIKAGASIVICARDITKLKEVEKQLVAMASSDQVVVAIQADVSKEKDVAHLVNESMKQLGTIDILVNNAGVYGPMGAIEDIAMGEWIKAIEVNLFSILFLCNKIIPIMKENRYGKIINLSGGGATAPLPTVSAYAASKAAVVRLTETLAEECREFGIDINAVAPGALNTRLLEEVLAAGADKVEKRFYEKALQQKVSGGTPLEKGAGLCVYLGAKTSDGITGKLISAVWDPWERFGEHITELQQTDIYTLRRIVPKDRGYDWGDDR